MTSEFIQIAEQILRNSSKPMTAKDIVDEAMDQGLFSDAVSGLTPHQTMKSKLSVWIRKNGSESLFTRTGPGKFWLRDKIESRSLYEAPRYEKPPSRERVLVFRTDYLASVRTFQGIQTNWRKFHRQMLQSKHAHYLDRMKAEQNNSYKQVLTYILVTRRDEVLCFRRGKYNRVEDFLRGSYCIGFGGHVIEEDNSLLSGSDLGLEDSARRELMEELNLPESEKKRLASGDGLELCGILNDDSSDVGRRHFAFIFKFELDASTVWDEPTKGEKSIAQLQWISAENGPHRIWKFEYWSQLCLRKYFPKLAEQASDYRIVRRSALSTSKLLLLIGSIGCGKSEASKIITRDFGYEEINSGRVLAKLMGIRPVSSRDRRSFQKRALAFIRSRDGPKRLASALWNEAQKKRGARVLIDGIRQRETYDALVRLARPLPISILYIHTLPDIAFKFYSSRENEHSTFEQFLRLRDADVEKGVPRFLSIADAVIYNWRGKTQYVKTVKSLMSELHV